MNATVSVAEIEEKVIAIIADQASVPVSQAGREVRLQDLPLDSLDDIEIVMSMEEAFGIKIPDEAIENIKTVGDAIDLVCKHI